MPCKKCRERVKDWNGSDPKCAFESGVFDTDNWNCATMNALREIADRDESRILYNEDERAYLMRGVWADEEGRGCDYVVLTWYKSRGCTTWAMSFFDQEPPQPLTLKEAEAILAQHEVTAKSGVLWRNGRMLSCSEADIEARARAFLGDA